MFHTDPFVFFYLAFLILMLPLPWLAAAIFAAAVHEWFHIAAIVLTGGSIRRMDITLHGAVIHASIPGPLRELFCALAGPAGSFLLLLFRGAFPRLCLCAAVQGCFNLLPLYPLDGGRALHCLICLLFPCKADWLCSRLDMILRWLLAMGAVLLLFSSPGSMGIVSLLLFVLLRKIPCKEEKIRVQ